MNQQWVVALPMESVSALANLRLLPGIDVLQQEQTVWLRGSRADDELSLKLRTIPNGERFSILSDKQLVPEGKQVPRGLLPEGQWQPVADWFTVELDRTAMSGRLDEHVSLQIERSDNAQQANILVTQLSHLHDYVMQAADIRLQPLLFAVDNQCRVIVKGLPLLPLDGAFYCEQECVAVQAGWRWEPRVDAKILRTLFKLQSGDLLLLHGGGSREIIYQDQFVKLTRSAVHLTMQDFNKNK